MTQLGDMIFSSAIEPTSVPLFEYLGRVATVLRTTSYVSRKDRALSNTDVPVTADLAFGTSPAEVTSEDRERAASALASAAMACGTTRAQGRGSKWHRTLEEIFASGVVNGATSGYAASILRARPTSDVSEESDPGVPLLDGSFWKPGEKRDLKSVQIQASYHATSGFFDVVHMKDADGKTPYQTFTTTRLRHAVGKIVDAKVRLKRSARGPYPITLSHVFVQCAKPAADSILEAFEVGRFAVPCNNETHVIAVAYPGRLLLLDHQDVEARKGEWVERALGRRLGCPDYFLAWEAGLKGDLRAFKQWASRGLDDPVHRLFHFFPRGMHYRRKNWRVKNNC